MTPWPQARLRSIPRGAPDNPKVPARRRRGGPARVRSDGHPGPRPGGAAADGEDTGRRRAPGHDDGGPVRPRRVQQRGLRDPRLQARQPVGRRGMDADRSRPRPAGEDAGLHAEARGGVARHARREEHPARDDRRVPGRGHAGAEVEGTGPARLDQLLSAERVPGMPDPVLHRPGPAGDGVGPGRAHQPPRVPGPLLLQGAGRDHGRPALAQREVRRE